MNRTSLSLSFEADGWAENVDLNVDIDVAVEVDADVEVDLVETEVEINVEAAVIVGDEAGQKVDEIERRSTTMSGYFAFSLWILHSFLLAFLGLWKLPPMVGWLSTWSYLFCGSHSRNVIHYLGLWTFGTARLYVFTCSI